VTRITRCGSMICTLAMLTLVSTSSAQTAPQDKKPFPGALSSKAWRSGCKLPRRFLRCTRRQASCRDLDAEFGG
jgi:hypothetical protein